MQANRTSHGKYIVTPDSFDRSRIRVNEKPSYSDGTNGDSYPVQYAYITPDGKEKLDYIHTILPTLSVAYGCTQREPETGGMIKADTKYGLTLGYRVIQEGNMRKPKIHEDENGNFVKWEEYPRVFKIQDSPTGNAFRGDDKNVTPEHSDAILKYYKMVSEIESEIRTQLAAIMNKNNKSLAFSDKNVLVRCSAKTPYQDIHAKVAQFKGKDGNTQVAMRVTTDFEGTRSIPFDEFCAKSGGARVAAWLTFPSVHVSSLGNPTVRCTVDRVLCKALGVDPNASRVSDVINPEDIPDGEEIDPSLLQTKSEPSPKRARFSEESSAQENEDVSVFA